MSVTKSSRHLRCLNKQPILWLLAFLVGCLPGFRSSSVQAGATAASWVVIVNGDSQNSRTIANHFVALRNIPARNVIVLREIPEGETITREVFVEKILKPILRELDARNLAAHIQGVAYSCDIPTRIVFEAPKDVPRDKAAWFTPIASINSATYLYQQVLANQNIVSLFNNFYCRLPVAQRLQIPIPDDMKGLLKKKTSPPTSTDATETESSSSESEPSNDNSESAPESSSPTDDKAAQILLDAASESDQDVSQLEVDSQFLEQYVKRFPYQSSAWFQLAALAAANDETDKAFDCLNKAVEAGWSYSRLMKEQPAFQKLRSDNRFQTLLLAVEDSPTDWTEPRGFDARLNYAPNGIETIDAKGGSRYLLSIVLAATQPVGNKMSDAIEALKISASADFTAPSGSFYFTSTSDVRTLCRESLFDLTIAKLKQAGFQAERVNSTFPIRKRDVLGVTMGSPSFSWLASGSKLIPGAIAENLTSYNGKLDSPGQTKLTEFLSYGAAGSSGAVEEPYSLQQKFPLPLIHESYARGATLAEAYYQSVLGPYQLLIVGDPLCQPWSKPPEINVSGVDIEQPITDKASIEISTKLTDGSTSPASVMVLTDGVVKTAGKGKLVIRVDPKTQSLQGYEEIRVIAQTDSAERHRRELVIGLNFGNADSQLELQLAQTNLAQSSAQSVEVRIPKAWPSDVTIMHNQEALGTIAAGETQTMVDASQLGKGPIRLQATATNGNRIIRSKYQTLSIE